MRRFPRWGPVSRPPEGYHSISSLSRQAQSWISRLTRLGSFMRLTSFPFFVPGRTIRPVHKAFVRHNVASVNTKNDKTSYDFSCQICFDRPSM